MEGKFIPLSVPNIRGNEIKYVTEALEAEWVSTGGAMIDKFESDIAQYVHSVGAVACQSGTAGLHLAMYYLGVGRGNLIIVPTLTFIAAVNPVRYLGAEPVFMDCDDSLCIDPVKLNEYLENECDYIAGNVYDRESGKQIKAIIAVHIFGNMADMETIMAIAERYNLPVIEDATEALGSYYISGKYKGKYAGTIGTIGVYSFNGNKIITTGGGGMMVSQSQDILNKLRYYSTQAKDDAVNFIHHEIGFNYRMTNIQAAMGIAQLEKLDEFIKTKTLHYNYYKQEIDRMNGLELLAYSSQIRSNYWFYAMVLDDSLYHKDEMMEYYTQHSIQTRPIWGLISEQKPYVDFKAYKIEKAKYYFDRIVNIPCSTNLTMDDVERVIQATQQFVGE